MRRGDAQEAKRRRLGLSQEGLAEATSLHPTYISLIERGKRCPSARVMLSLAAGLGTKGSTLMAAVERELAKTGKVATQKPRVPRGKASAKR